MARPKKTVKAKEPVRLRYKELANGNKSLYLDIYHDGKRSYEFLKLYLMPEINEEIKNENEKTLETADEIKNKRINAIRFKKMGETDKSEYAKMLLSDLMDIYADSKEQDGHIYNGRNTMCVLTKRTKEMLLSYHGKDTKLQDIDEEFCIGFIRFIKKAKKANGELYAQATTAQIQKVFSTVLNYAVNKGYWLKFNPMGRLKSEKIKTPDSTREYLTEEEVKALAKTPCKKEYVKRAFLFSCFTGLRCSDLQNLKWENVITDGENKMITFKVIKTGKVLSIPLNKNAIMFMGEQGNAKPSDKIFSFPVSQNYWNEIVKGWAKSANINKKVTFHIARHTFATLTITRINDIYTVSKLLGHSNVQVTQIYAKVVEKKKQEAVNALDNVEIEM